MTDDPLKGVGPDRLRKIIKNLTPERKPRPETHDQALARIEARRLAQARLDAIESAQMKYEVLLEDPAVQKLQDSRVAHAAAEAEARQHLRHEEPVDEPTSPALRALRSDAEKQRELIWAQFNPEGGWSA